MDPQVARAEWRNRFDLARARVAAERDRIRDGLAARAGASGATTARLERLAAGQDAYLAELEAILGDTLGQGGAPLESHVALRTRLPASQGLLTYESNVFRDWCWGAAENAAALDEVLAALADSAPRRVLVLGAGAGRLAYDLHQATGAVTTVALDVNPLLACVGQRVSAGETLMLTEFPLAPADAAAVALSRRLAAPAPARAGLSFVLGDALRAPFAAGAFDAVITPWLLDILEAPVSALLAELDRLLAPGGNWINHGSVGFASADPVERLTAEELSEQAERHGFRVSRVRERELPYLCCPESRHRRAERVLTFRAEHQHSVRAAVAPYRALPTWIEDRAAPIPLLPAIQAQALATRTHAYILSLVDGRRSIDDIAAVLARHGIIDEAGGRAALRGFFTALHDDVTRARAF